jgi:hypothetical protein
MKPATAGYSGTPLPSKLGLKSSMKFIALNAPPDLDLLLAGAPDLQRLARVALFDCALALRRMSARSWRCSRSSRRSSSM